MSRLLLAAAAAIFFLLAVDQAWAQDALRAASSNGNPSDTFPAALGYVALTAMSAAGGVMSTVIGKLWKAQRDQDKLHGESLAELRKDHRKAIQLVKDECNVQIDQMRTKLEVEQRDRREEAERLLREQKDIMKEVMVTCIAVSTALEGNTKTLAHLADQLAGYGEAEED